MRRRRRTDGEINLTPLLDVLFVILFVVMLSGMQSEKTNADAREESREKIEALETEVEELTDEGRIAELEEQVRSLTEELEKRKDLEETGKAFESRAVLVTIRNTAEEQAGEGGAKAQAKHYLSVYAGPEDAERGTFLMGSGRQEYTRTQLTSILRSILSETDPEVPVYAVFHCDSDKILHKEESEIIKEALRSFRETEYSNFYYQVLEE